MSSQFRAQNTPNSVTACQRCRDQKLKCSRERPVCTRCRRLQANCVYPSPPSRRGRKLQRNLRRVNPGGGSGQNLSHLPSMQTRDEAAEFDRTTPVLTTVNGLESINDSSHSYPTQLRKARPTRTELVSNSDPPLPPRAIGLSLLEVYFTRIYNASLLFHKPVLFRDYLDGKLHDILLKAIFALSTLFLSPLNEDDQEGLPEQPELRILSPYCSCGLPWANAALREAMPLAAQEQSLMVTQALQCLQHYWFGVGDPYSANLCLTLAYRSCQLLGYNKLTTDDADKPGLSLESELKSRCFWACWVSTCIVGAPEPYIRSAWQEVEMLPLPACIHDTAFGYEIISKEWMDNKWCSRPVHSHEPDHPQDAAALLVKIVGVWTKVQLLITDSSHLTMTEKLDCVEKLSDLATSVFDMVLPEVDISSENGRLMLFCNALYHQCQITLHSMIVPLFSGTSIEGISRETVRRSAESVICHAHLFERLLTPYLYEKADTTHLASLVGHGAFLTAMVLLATDISYRVRASHTGRHREHSSLTAVRAILNLLNILWRHWQPLQHHYEKLRAALEVNFSTNDTHLEANTPRRERSTGRSIRDSDRIQSNYVNTSWGSAHESRIQSPCPSNDVPQSLARSQFPVEMGISPENAVEETNSPFNNVDSRCADGSLTAQLAVTEEDAWYSLSFAEAGIEQFAGYEPLPLFQQGWMNFG